VGLQLLLSFGGHDVAHVPRVPLQTFWRSRRRG
jgi:hypothetical protein